MLTVGGKLELASWLATISSLTDNYFRSIGSYVLMGNVSSRWSNGPQTSRTSFCRYICSGSEIYFRNSVYITTFPCSWPRDHGGRRSYTRPGRNGCRIGFPGRWNRIQLERIEAFVRRGVLLGLYRPGDPTQTPNLMPTTATTTSSTAY